MGRVRYQAMPQQSRFWLHSEACYTEDELNFRALVLSIRTNSGIHSDYLTNPSSWFADIEQAFTTVYENSWFFSHALRPRHILSRDDFLVQPIDNQRLQWPDLYDLMQRTGDYLLTRNQNLPVNHLNQPMNYILLDINNILKGISQNPNIEQTIEQLNYLVNYVRNIEKNISPLIGSDRLFLADFRDFINDEIQPYLSQRIEAQLLRDRMSSLAKSITQLSEERHRILHFALSDSPVNPHPHDAFRLESGSLKDYPVLAAQACAHQDKEALIKEDASLKILAQQLRDCPDFHLIKMTKEVLEPYAQGSSELKQLKQFKEIIEKVIELLGQAGEVYTVYQFQEQLSLLLGQMAHFIDTSSQPIKAIIRENEQAYHKAIHDEQNLSFFKRMLTSERDKLNTFIHNQDILSQFPSSMSDLLKINTVIKQSVSQIITHLSQAGKRTNFSGLAEKAQQLNTLMGEMHHWTSVQYQIQGLKAPQEPEKLLLFTENTLGSVAEISFFKNNTLNQTISNYTMPTQQLLLASETNQASQINMSFSWMGLLLLLPIGALALYWLAQAKTPPAPVLLGNKETFDEWLFKVEDLITQIKESAKTNAFQAIEYANFIDTYQGLKANAQLGNYEVSRLIQLHEDMNYFYSSFQQREVHCF